MVAEAVPVALKHRLGMQSPDFIWADSDIFAIRTDRLALLVSLQRLAHVIRIATVRIIICDSTEYGVAVIEWSESCLLLDGMNFTYPIFL
jgi:hypothetical protein